MRHCAKQEVKNEQKITKKKPHNTHTHLWQLTRPYRFDNARAQILDRIHAEPHHEIVPDTDREREALRPTGRLPAQQSRWRSERVHAQIRKAAAQFSRKQNGNARTETVPRKYERILGIGRTDTLQYVALAQTLQHTVNTGHHAAVGGRVRWHAGCIEAFRIRDQIGEDVPHRQTAPDRDDDAFRAVIRHYAEW